MTSIQVKNVDEETHRVLRTRAAHAHQSLQEYVLGVLSEHAAQPTMNEIFDRLNSLQPSSSDITMDEITAMVREDRDRH